MASQIGTCWIPTEDDKGLRRVSHEEYVAYWREHENEDDSQQQSLLDDVLAEDLSPEFHDFKCTCGNLESLDLHDVRSCDLWEVPEFADGWAVWDGETRSLVLLPDEDEEADADDKAAATTDTPNCKCLPPKTTLWCIPCGVERKDKDSPWEWDSYDWSGFGGMTSKCRHYFQAVTFPDGTTVRASSVFDPDERKAGEWPDFGCYMDRVWQPASLAYHLAWKDFGLPKVSHKDVHLAVTDCLTKARSGLTVEVGCIGGHGRTGSLLALMATHCGVAAADAVKWVRDNYCSHAVEGYAQSWYVLSYAALVRGEQPPAYDPPKYTKTTTAKADDKSAAAAKVSAPITKAGAGSKAADKSSAAASQAKGTK